MRKLNTLPSANVRKLPNCTRLPRPKIAELHGKIIKSETEHWLEGDIVRTPSRGGVFLLSGVSEILGTASRETYEALRDYIDPSKPAFGLSDSDLRAMCDTCDCRDTCLFRGRACRDYTGSPYFFKRMRDEKGNPIA